MHVSVLTAVKTCERRTAPMPACPAGVRHSPVLLTAMGVHHVQLGGHVLCHRSALHSCKVRGDGNSEVCM